MAGGGSGREPDAELFAQHVRGLLPSGVEPFSRINPCGYAGLQTVDLSTIGVHTTWEDAANVLARQLLARLAP